MTGYLSVDPAAFIRQELVLPANGRGAWTKSGIGFSWRPQLNPPDQPRIGTIAEKSLDHWAVSAGVHAIQRRLVELGHMDPVSDIEAGMFGPRTATGLGMFQAKNSDPDTDAALSVDGTFGRGDARAMFTPLIDRAERASDIPEHFLRGEMNHESALDPGAVGYFIYYARSNVVVYGGVDRGIGQINSKAQAQVSWSDAYDPAFAIPWSAKRMRAYYDAYSRDYPNRSVGTRWDAAICAHNSPANGLLWIRAGYPTNETAATYVASVKAARY